MQCPRALLCLAAAAAFVAGPGPHAAWNTAHAGAWILPQGKGQVIAKLSHTDAPDAFDPGGGTAKGAHFEKAELEIFAEYGWRETVTLFAKPVLQHVRSGSETKHGFASLEAGGRLRLHRFAAGGVLGAQASAILPGGKFHREHPLLTSGHADVDARLLFGEPAGFLGFAGYADMQLAYRHRGGPPADEVRVDVTYGLDLSDRWAMAVHAQTVATVGAVRPPFSHYRSQKLQGSLRFALGGGRHIEAGALRTVSGAATVRETGGFIALWTAF